MKLSQAQRAAIARDRRPYKLIANEFGIKPAQVSVVKQRAGVAGSKTSPNRGVAVEKRVLPDRFYRPTWDANS